MFSTNLIEKLRAALSIQSLSEAICSIQDELPGINCALLLPKGVHQEDRETWLGKVNTEMNQWVQSEAVRRQLESDHALLPLHFTEAQSDTSRGFVLSTSTPTYAAVWLIVELLDGELHEADVLNFMALGRYIADAYHRITLQSSHLLTEREQECMRWIAQGKTSWEVAQILGLAERTVNFHIQNCIHKTNSVNRSQAITKCITQALIHVSH